MPLYRDEAVVIRTHKLGESDRIVTMLSKGHGQIRAVAKGVRKTSSRFGARLEPFMVVDVMCYEGRSLDTVSQAETLATYGAAISEDFERFHAANVMVETAEKLTTENPAPQQYVLLVGALRALALGENPTELVRDAYLLRAIALAGWAPSFVACAKCGAEVGDDRRFLDVAVGGVVCHQCAVAGTQAAETATVELLAQLLTGDWPNARQSVQHNRSAASAFVAAYTQWHLDRSLRSLSSKPTPPAGG